MSLMKKIAFAALAITILLGLSSSATAQTETELIKSSAVLKERKLHVEMLLNNPGEEESGVTIKVNYLGQVDKVVESIPAQTNKLFTYKIPNIKPGKVRIAVLSDTNSFLKINVPENFSEKNSLQVQKTTFQEWKRNVPESGPLSGVQVALNYLLRSPDALAIGTVILILAASLLGLKIFFRKKSEREKEVESAEKLLREAEEIERKDE